VSFAIFDNENGAGNALWSEDQTLGLTDGFYATQLGAVTPIDSVILDTTGLWLSITVAGEQLTPLQKIGSVAYALHADTAKNLSGGSVDASSLTVNGVDLVDGTGQLNTGSLLPTCGPGDVLQWNGTVWDCGSVSGSISAGAGVQINSGTISLGSCPSGEVWKSNGASWVCAADNDTLTTWSNLAGIPADLADGDANTTYAAGTGITITGGNNAINSTLGTSIDSSEIVDGAITNADLANNAVTAAKISDGTITTADIANNAITGAKIANGTITGADLASPLALSGQFSAVGFDKTGDGLNCTIEFDLIETGNNTATYWPSSAKRAELMQNGWICWNRANTNLISPTTVDSHSIALYAAWNSATQQICGPITYMSPTTNYILSWVPNYYFGLRYMAGTVNTTHGRWANNTGEATTPSGAGDRWTIYTCY